LPQAVLGRAHEDGTSLLYCLTEIAPLGKETITGVYLSVRGGLEEEEKEEEEEE